MGGFAEYDLSEDGDGGNVLALSGPYLVSTVGAIDQDLRALDGPIARIDLADVTEIDTVGAWIACSLAREHEAEISGASERAERLMGALKGTGSEEQIAAPRLPVWERVPTVMG
ncbi:MAG TPA: ABC transporter permease, partial [Erythrobacter sp.]|nr:ABC transporter permease [Erythrobacter sp.]HBQ54588.1 ABC transporter permease [Erythrobacter sp.]